MQTTVAKVPPQTKVQLEEWLDMIRKSFIEWLRDPEKTASDIFIWCQPGMFTAWIEGSVIDLAAPKPNRFICWIVGYFVSFSTKAKKGEPNEYSPIDYILRNENLQSRKSLKEIFQRNWSLVVIHELNFPEVEFDMLIELLGFGIGIPEGVSKEIIRAVMVKYRYNLEGKKKFFDKMRELHHMFSPPEERTENLG